MLINNGLVLKIYVQTHVMHLLAWCEHPVRVDLLVDVLNKDRSYINFHML